MAEHVAFIGLGSMGYHMAGHIRKKMSPSATLYINDIYRSSCERFKEEFGSLGQVDIVDTPKEAATKATIVMTIVPRAPDVRKIYLDETTGISQAPKNPNRLLLECSTIDIESTLDVAKKVTEAGSGVYIDTPVSGGVTGAQAATLSFLIGYAAPSTDAEPIPQRIINLFSMMGLPHKITFCGKLGAGLVVKLANNYISCSTMIAVAEGMAIGVRNGIDKKVLYECLHNSTAQSWVLDNMTPLGGCVPHAPSSNNYAPSFKPFMMVKDLTLASQAGRQAGIKPIMAETALGVFEKAAEDPRCMDRDCTSVFLYINEPK